MTLRQCSPFPLTPRSQAGHKLQDSPASWEAQEGWDQDADSGPHQNRPQTSSCPPCSALSELTDITVPASLLPEPFPECQQQFPGRPGDSSLSQPRGNPMPWCQRRVSPGAWGMGLRLCRAGLPEGVGGLPPPSPPAPSLFHT